VAPIQNAPIRSVQIPSTHGLGGLSEATRQQIVNSVSSYAKTDPATGFRAVVTIPNTIQANQSVRDIMLTKLTKCVKRITNYYGLPMPPRLELIFYDPSTGPRTQVPSVGSLELRYAVRSPNTYFTENNFVHAHDCFVSTHEMAHAIGPYSKGSLEEGYATFSQLMLGPALEEPLKCAEEGYCASPNNSTYYLFPYALVHQTQVNGELFRKGPYLSGLCAWAYIQGKFSKNKLQQVIDRFESAECTFGNCITDFILPVLGEQETRLFEQKFDLRRTDNARASPDLQPIRQVDSCDEVQSANWWRRASVIDLPIGSLRNIQRFDTGRRYLNI